MESGTPEHVDTPAPVRERRVVKDARGRFAKGNLANPSGRPKGSVGGRKRFMKMFDELVGDQNTLERLKLALAGQVVGDPLDFIRNYLYPLLPKETVLAIEDDVAKAGVRLTGLDPPSNGDGNAASGSTVLSPALPEADAGNGDASGSGAGGEGGEA